MHSTCQDATTKTACHYVSLSAMPLTPEETNIRAVAYYTILSSGGTTPITFGAIPLR